jgi:hypothetical protein
MPLPDPQVPAKTDTASARDQPVLPAAEVTRRVTLLAELQDAFTAHDVQAVLVRNRRIVLRATGTGLEPSGPTNPQLHVFLGDGTEIATTDGTQYEFTTGPAHLIGDPQAAATSLLGRLPAHR